MPDITENNTQVHVNSLKKIKTGDKNSIRLRFQNFNPETELALKLSMVVKFLSGPHKTPLEVSVV